MLELLVVLVIIGLISALVAPRFGGVIEGSRTRSCARKIAASLRYAGNQAAVEKVMYVSLFDFENDLMSTGIPEASETGEIHLKNEKTYRFPEGVTLKSIGIGESLYEEKKVFLTFYPSGSGSGGVIRIGGEEEEEAGYEVKVNFITGVVRILSMDEDG